MNLFSFFLKGDKLVPPKYKNILEQVNSFEQKVVNLKDQDFPQKTKEFKERLKKGQSLDDILPEAFALVREAAKRTLNQRHFDVQILGGIALHEGKIAEMKTGEGKTLSATLPLYLNALLEKGCHLITVNDYLSRRDTVWMGQIYYFLGLSCGCLNHEQSFLYDPVYKRPDEEKERVRDEFGTFKVVEDFLRPVSRQEAYLADITYGTNNEFGFDYLRDNLVLKKEDLVQREHYFAIVDEVDFILIDEARTPLIISAPSEEATDIYKECDQIIKRLKKEVDYIIDEKQKTSFLTKEGQDKIVKILGKDPWEEMDITYVHHLENALRANVNYLRDREYVVKNGQVIIVDEFTGRLMPGRRYSEGLHQAIEAKEGVEIQKESQTLATISFQNYFRMYEKLAGMTGTALSSAEEFEKVYGLDVIPIPTNKPMIRIDHQDKIYKNENGKYRAIIEEIKKRHQKGQPVLVGTTSINKNEKLSMLLKREGISHSLLNAKNHEKEGEIIAQAGKWGAVTVATNMAGRGVDIILGGNPPDKEEQEKIREIGGLCVIGSERHESRRIDDQLRGRAGRQGDPGESMFFVSLEDDLMRIFGGDRLKNLMERFNFPEDLPIENKIISRSIESAQQKVEGYNFDLRKHLLDFDDVLNKQREKIYKERRKILEGDENYLTNFLVEINKEIEGDEKLFQEKLMELKNGLQDKFVDFIRFLFLRNYDFFWRQHLEDMEALRDSVRLRAYGQIDPVVAYRKDGTILFREMLKNIKNNIVETILKVQSEKNNLVQIANKEHLSSKISQNFSTPSNSKNISQVSSKPKVGRNDPCPCGKIDPTTGKPMKYKKCCYPKYG